MTELSIIEKNILVNHQSQTREEIIRTLGDLLYENGYVKDTFTEAVLDREIIFPTGLQTKTVGVAIPHTDSEHVETSTVAIATLASPVIFMGMGYPDLEIPVSIVMMLAISDPKKVVDTLTKVISVLENETTIEMLVNASTETAIKNAFLEHLSSYDAKASQA
jgi:PTS system galactitol-specific IIA component